MGRRRPLLRAICRSTQRQRRCRKSALERLHRMGKGIGSRARHRSSRRPPHLGRKRRTHQSTRSACHLRHRSQLPQPGCLLRSRPILRNLRQPIPRRSRSLRPHRRRPLERPMRQNRPLQRRCLPIRTRRIPKSRRRLRPLRKDVP